MSNKIIPYAEDKEKAKVSILSDSLSSGNACENSFGK